MRDVRTSHLRALSPLRMLLSPKGFSRCYSMSSVKRYCSPRNTRSSRNENPPRIFVDAGRVALCRNQPAATFTVTLPVARSSVNALPFTTRSANWVPLKVTTELRVVTVVPFVASVRVTL